MSMSTAPASAAQIETLAKAAGLDVTGVDAGTDFSGRPTVKVHLALAADAAKTTQVELSETFDASEAKFSAELEQYFAEMAVRLRNPRPDCYMSVLGLPLSFGNFAWPFHGSTSGADTFIVHGEIHLETGGAPELHAKVSASLTQTFAEVVAALEQPFAEGFIYNAVRKTLDQGQLELVKSGNRQPVPVTTRYYSMKQQRFIFNDASEQQRSEFLAAKAFWMSGVLGGSAPVWLADPRDAQYLNTTVEDLRTVAAKLVAKDWIIASEDFGSPTAELMERRPAYEAEVAAALAFLKPTFNEDMRGGHTNM